MSKGKSTTKPAASSIVITLEIFPADAKGNRKLILAGAPHGEMPELRTGTFADRHKLLDDLWVALAKREPQIVKATSATIKADTAEQGSVDENAVAETDSEPSATPTEQAFENSVANAANGDSTDATSEPVRVNENDQLVMIPNADTASTPVSEEFKNAVRPASQQSQLPLIENDPTLITEDTNG